jgi:hypothetical protein
MITTVKVVIILTVVEYILLSKTRVPVIFGHKSNSLITKRMATQSFVTATGPDDAFAEPHFATIAERTKP